MTKDLMLRHWTNTLVNRDFPRTLSWKVSNPLTSPVNPVPRESGSGVRVCKASGDRMSLSEVARFCRLFIVKLFLDSTRLVSPYERFLDWRGTVEELDPLGLLSDNWERIVPDTEKALSMGIDFHKRSNYKHKIIVPFKKTKHFNKMLTEGTINKGIRLSKDKITFMFEMPKKEKKEKGSTLGIDIGQTTLLSCSDNQISNKDNHGHDLTSITNKISRKQKGSLGFERASIHRKNYINWSINQLNLENVKQINIENIKNLRKGQRISRKLSHWTYTDIFGKLESYCEEQGVLVNKVNPTYTSQRCSECGWTRKSNRKGKSFKCGKCGFTLDADLNASRNIALEGLPAIRKPQRLKQPNRLGFYWNVLGQEPRVSVVQRTLCSFLSREGAPIK